MLLQEYLATNRITTDTYSDMDKLLFILLKERKTPQIYILHDSMYVIFCKREHFRDRDQLNDCQRMAWGTSHYGGTAQGDLLYAMELLGLMNLSKLIDGCTTKNELFFFCLYFLCKLKSQ